MDAAARLLKGACDIHVHPGPSLVPRILDDYEAVRSCVEAGITAVVLKDQYFVTTQQARLFNEYVFKGSGTTAYGAVALNNTVGGLSPHVVDAAIKSGARIIWMPTVSAEAHIERAKERAKKGLAHKGVPLPKDPLYPVTPMKLTDQKGDLLSEVSEICRLIAKADVAMGTGHVTFSEASLLVDEANRLGVKKIIIDHPNILGYTEENILQMVEKGGIVEFATAVAVKEEGGIEEVIKLIRLVKPENAIIVSDLGLPGYPLPVDGLKQLLTALLDNGISESDIEIMIKKNPKKLLNLE